MTKKEIDELSYKIIGAAIEVHRELGPTLMESMYHKCLKKELQLQGINFQSELSVDIEYKGEKLQSDLRCDLLVDDKIVVELKAVNEMHPIFEAQLLSYMKMLKKPKGILINFHCHNIFRNGQKTFVNELYRDLK